MLTSSPFVGISFQPPTCEGVEIVNFPVEQEAPEVSSLTSAPHGISAC